MSDSRSEQPHPGSPLTWVRRTLRGAWNDLLSVYYANTTVWRLLKSGALVALGLFCWSGANLVLSYRPDWTVLYYVMSYGFALLFWGPLTHLVIVPAVIRMRRSGNGGLRRQFARHGSKANLTVFLLLVLVLGTVPLGVMTFEFQVPADGDGGVDINPQLQCTKSGELIHCHVSDSRGIDSVVVSTGGQTLQKIDDPPFDFNVNVNNLEESGGDRQFTVELRDENGEVIRRYIRRAELIPG
ncbi:hypothetical protein ACH9L7_08310 [Haloferax sp. S1W]|uniref:hypothetical protein n=1 Tax=Haloferax sp. S1W TaxID=3377110 RepID=UPI0037CADD51